MWVLFEAWQTVTTWPCLSPRWLLAPPSPPSRARTGEGIVSAQKQWAGIVRRGRSRVCPRIVGPTLMRSNREFRGGRYAHYTLVLI